MSNSCFGLLHCFYALVGPMKDLKCFFCRWVLVFVWVEPQGHSAEEHYQGLWLHFEHLIDKLFSRCLQNDVHILRLFFHIFCLFFGQLCVQAVYVLCSLLLRLGLYKVLWKAAFFEAAAWNMLFHLFFAFCEELFLHLGEISVLSPFNLL